ncbi:hypothetical protein [Chenggangzhangella methanolivorans]|uniref:Uncharacterized protein n=1 Tax=Chenggangzhangella methanolivorans TaxID=1437009 RepID=A0A9E6R5L4_9HYPH|nr:hypothetical protein [Chenggangzhangella methanolivorans]QZN98630.1 hypothetical protein K6K41_16580 [Chenggangzhangella methanolivorans]
MPDALFTLTDLAETVAKSFKASEDQQRLFHRQAKNLLNQRLIEATTTKGGRRDSLLDLREAAKARIQLAVIDAGLDATTLRAIDSFWDRAAEASLGLPIINGCYPPRALDACLRDAADRKAPAWDFVIIILRGLETGERTIMAAFERADQPERPEEDPMSGRGPHADGVEVAEGNIGDDGNLRWRTREALQTIATIRLPATALVRPLLEA